MRRNRGFFSWVATSVLTVVSAVGIVAMTTGNLTSTSASTATNSAAATASANTGTSTTAAPVHLTTYKVTYRGDSSRSGDN